MSYLLPLAALAFANMLGIISPGPAFIMVSRAAAGRGLDTALGLGAGVAIAATTWAAAASFGIAFLMSEFASVYGVIQLLGGAYLIWLGIGAWRGSGKRGPVQADAAAIAHPGERRDAVRGSGRRLAQPRQSENRDLLLEHLRRAASRRRAALGAADGGCDRRRAGTHLVHDGGLRVLASARARRLCPRTHFYRARLGHRTDRPRGADYCDGENLGGGAPWPAGVASPAGLQPAVDS